MKLVRQAMNLMPSTLAASLIMKMVSKPIPFQTTEEQNKAQQTAKRIYWGANGQNVAYHWGNTDNLVLMFHGWGGCAAQLAPMAETLHQKGYNLLAVDFTAHGESAGKKISFEQLMNDVQTIYQKFGSSVHSVIAHSAGAMCLMAVHQLTKIHTPKAVFINAPITPYPPMEIIKRKLDPSQRLLSACDHLILSQFQGLISKQGDPGCYKPIEGMELLVVNDLTDKITKPADGETIANLWPNSQRFLTKSLGHNGPLEDNATIENIIYFLKS